MPKWTSRITGHHNNPLPLALLFTLLAGSVFAQQPFPSRPGEEPPKKLPDGRLQSEVLLKEDHKKNLADLAKIRELANSIEDELKRGDRHVLSLKALKDLEEIEKIARRVRQRMKRY